MRDGTQFSDSWCVLEYSMKIGNSLLAAILCIFVLWKWEIQATSRVLVRISSNWLVASPFTNLQSKILLQVLIASLLLYNFWRFSILGFVGAAGGTFWLGIIARHCEHSSDMARWCLSGMEGHFLPTASISPPSRSSHIFMPGIAAFTTSPFIHQCCFCQL
jgi:hypothetical protein